MKKILCLFLVGCGLALGAEQLPVYPNRGEEYHLELTDAPFANGMSGIRLSWTDTPAGYAELFLRQPVQLGKLAEQRVTIALGDRAPASVRQVNLRVRDASGEVFQYTPENPTDLTQATFVLSPAKFQSCWGGDGNRQPNGNVEISAMTVLFAKPHRSGFIQLGMPALAGKASAATASRRQCINRFDAGELWRFSRGRGKMEVRPDGLLLTLDGPGDWVLEERKRRIVTVPGLLSGTFAVDLLEGGASFALEINGMNNCPEMLPYRSLKPGENRIVFSLPETRMHVNQPLFRLGIRSDAEGPVRLLLRSLTGMVRCRPLEDVAVTLQTGSRLPLLQAEDAVEKLAVHFENRGVVVRRFSAESRFRDIAGREFVKKFDLTLKPGAEKTMPVGIHFPALGYWCVDTVLRDAGNPETTTSSRAAFAILSGEKLSVSPEHFVFGVHSHPHRWSVREQELEAQAAGMLGVSVLRWGIPWAMVQKEKNGKWDFTEPDAMAARFGRYGIAIAPILSLPPRWAISPTWSPVRKKAGGSPLPTDDGWRSYVRETAKHFKGRIRYYEQWNEPDLVSFVNFPFADYVRIFRVGAQEIHAVDPDAKVLSSGFSSMLPQVNSNTRDFVPAALAALRRDFDIQAHHEHGDYDHFRDVIDGPFTTVRRKLGITGPWYANETSIHSAGNTDRRQAETLFRKLVFAWSRGAMGYNWYNLRNDGFSVYDNEQNFGLMTHDFQPKMAYPVYYALIRLYQGAVFQREIPAGREGRLLVFTTPSGKQLIAGWSENNEYPAAFLLRTNATQAQRIDLMGNRTPLAVRENLLLFAPGNEPATLELPAGSSVEFAGELLRAEVTSPAIVGRKMTFKLQLVNPFRSAQVFAFLFAPPAGIVMPERMAVTVPGESEQEFPLSAEVSPAFNLPFGSEASLKINCSLTPTDCRSSFFLPIRSVTAIPQGAFQSKPDFSLNRREQTVSKVGFDPATSHLVWTGPEDLSAEVRLCRVEHALELEIRVTDDRHVQPYSGEKVWMGDNVQLAMKLPGQSGLWEIGLTRLASGKPEVWVWRAPEGFRAADVCRRIALTVSREGTQTLYRATIPDAAVGMAERMGKIGFRFNLLVNDNDGELREGWIHIAPGIGEEKSPDRYPLIVF